jgi:hypothetical protein
MDGSVTIGRQRALIRCRPRSSRLSRSTSPLQVGWAHGLHLGCPGQTARGRADVYSSLMREMRAIAFVTKLIDDGKICGNSMKRMLLHGLDATDVMTELGALDELNADWTT